MYIYIYLCMYMYTHTYIYICIEAIFLSARIAPEFVAPSKGKGDYVLNTLSHVVSHQV